MALIENILVMRINDISYTIYLILLLLDDKLHMKNIIKTVY